MLAGWHANGPHNSGPDFGKASPFGLLVVVLLLISLLFLVRSMNRHLKKLPESFDPQHPEPDQAVDDGTIQPAIPMTDHRMSPAARRAGATARRAASPYLRQHADNPVHWQQWSPQALAEAAKRDVPILLSVGYAACHWCHVMAHESFEDDEVAAAMNARLRVHQGGPRGAARHRRRLHECHRRAHRAGRLADDVFPDARRSAVLLRHLLSQSRFSAASFGRVQYLA